MVYHVLNVKTIIIGLEVHVLRTVLFQLGKIQPIKIVKTAQNLVMNALHSLAVLLVTQDIISLRRNALHPAHRDFGKIQIIKNANYVSQIVRFAMLLINAHFVTQHTIGILHHQNVPSHVQPPPGMIQPTENVRIVLLHVMNVLPQLTVLLAIQDIISWVIYVLLLV